MVKFSMAKIVDRSILKIIQEVENLSLQYLKCTNTKIHGVEHLRQVAYLSGRLALCNNVNIMDAVIAGYLHDCSREDDEDGNVHAHESAYLAQKIIRLNWTNVNFEKIFNSIYYHADGMITNDPLLGCVWDADRLGLVRLGTLPDQKLLSTQIAKRFHSRYIEDHSLLQHIYLIAEKVSNQFLKLNHASIGIWYSEASMMVLQFLLNILENDYNFDLRNLLIYSLFEYEGIPKNHDQSCCYQIYQQTSNRLSLSQVISPIEILDKSDLDQIRIQCIVSCTRKCTPSFDLSIINSNSISSYSLPINTRHYLSRFYEKIDNTPVSSVTFSRDFFESLDTPILIIDSSFSLSGNDLIVPETWHTNKYRIAPIFVQL